MTSLLSNKPLIELLSLADEYNIEREQPIRSLITAISEKIQQRGTMNPAQKVVYEFPPGIGHLVFGSLREWFEASDWVAPHQQAFKNRITHLNCNGLQLRSLEGCPPNVVWLSCISGGYSGGIALTSVKGCPEGLETLICRGNKIDNWEGCPENLKEINCDKNLFKTLRGLENLEKLEKLSCNGNPLISLKGCPKNLKVLDCEGCQLSSLEGCPSTIETINYSGNPLKEEWKNLSLSEIKNKLKQLELAQELKLPKNPKQTEEIERLAAENILLKNQLTQAEEKIGELTRQNEILDNKVKILLKKARVTRENLNQRSIRMSDFE